VPGKKVRSGIGQAHQKIVRAFQDHLPSRANGVQRSAGWAPIWHGGDEERKWEGMGETRKDWRRPGGTTLQGESWRRNPGGSAQGAPRLPVGSLEAPWRPRNSESLAALASWTDLGNKLK